MDYYAIGQKIRKYRKTHNLYREQLTEITNISITHISHIETENTKLNLTVLVSIAERIRIQTGELLFDHIAIRQDALNQLSNIIDSCSPKELKLISETIKSIKCSLDILYPENE